MKSISLLTPCTPEGQWGGGREAGRLMKALGPDCALVEMRIQAAEKEGVGRWCGNPPAAFCPAFPRPHEQIFRPQSLDLMSRRPQDDRRPGVREQELEVLCNHLKSLIVQPAGGCEVPAARRRGM